MTVWKRWIQSMKKKTAGTTLVELIVTFALIGIFMTAASFMLSSTLNLFARMQATSSAVTVSDLLLDKIAGEIAAAREPQMDKNDEASQGYYFWMADDTNSEWITMWNRSGSPLAIYAEPVKSENPSGGKVLCLKYYETVRGDANVSRSGTTATIPEVNWHFDESVYMGYRITDDGLTFTREDPTNHPNVIRIDLEIRNERTGFTYQTSRYAESYNYEFKLDQVHKYMGVRSDGIADAASMPVTAEEFMIRGTGAGGGDDQNPEPEKPEVTYYVRHMCEGEMLLEEEFEGIAGTSVTIYAKNALTPGFENYIPKEVSKEIIVDETGVVRTYSFEYEQKKTEEELMVYFVSNRTGKELGRKDYTDLGLNRPIGLSLPYIAGYVTPKPEWLEITFTDAVKSYTFYYEPKRWNYTVHFWTRGNQSLWPDQKGEIYTDDSIVIEAPVVPGYVPERPSLTITAIGDDVGGNQYTLYYDLKKGDSEHPFVTNGDKIKVEENDSTAGWPWPGIAGKIKEFFDSPWNRVEGDDKIGYYQTFVYEGKEYVIGGWENKKGNLKELESIIRQHNGNPECEIMIINSESSNSEVLHALLLYCAKQANATETELSFIRNSDIKFEFDDGVNLEEIKIEQKHGGKKEIEIEYEN